MGSTEVGLALSGGGFRAVQFHMGALEELNRLGLLKCLRRISGVSGGAIVAAMLGVKWRLLRFTSAGQAENLRDEIITPLRSLTKTTIDIGAILHLGIGSANRHLAKRLDQILYGGETLQSFPDDLAGPRVILCATDAQRGHLYRMSRPYARDWQEDRPWVDPELPISVAVAASAAFPPLLAPARISTPNGPKDLIDGGVYDNYGLEVHLRKDYHLLVSDGGQIFSTRRYPSIRPLATRRVMTLIEQQGRRLRRRQLAARTPGTFSFWSLSTPVGSYPKESAAFENADSEYGDWTVSTRLAALSEPTAERILEIGRSRCQAALAAYPIGGHGC